MEQLRKKIDSFILSEDYHNYLFLMAKKLVEQDQFSDTLMIYMTVRDIDKYSEGLKQQLYEAGKREVTFRQAGDSIIGGFIAEEPGGSIRINLSIEALLEDNKPYIMQTLFQTIETGEAYGV
jgi:vacuolar-type H+-ATPase subunit E/Vma4